MFGFWRRGTEEKDVAATTVDLIGEGYRRAYVQHLLGDRAKVEAELVSGKRAHLLAEMGPEVVVLDCASGGVNPPLALPDGTAGVGMEGFDLRRGAPLAQQRAGNRRRGDGSVRFRKRVRTARGRRGAR